MYRKNHNSYKNVDFQSNSWVNRQKFFSEKTRESNINIRQIESTVVKNEMFYFGDNLHNIPVNNLIGKITAHLNINSIGNKFTCLEKGITYYIGMLMISVRQIHDYFSVNQFLLDRYITSYRLECNSNGYGILVFHLWRHTINNASFFKSRNWRLFNWTKPFKKKIEDLLLL